MFEEMLVCECCMLWLVNDDDSACRDYYGHTHAHPKGMADFMIDPDRTITVTEGWNSCEACGTPTLYGAQLYRFVRAN